MLTRDRGTAKWWPPLPKPSLATIWYRSFKTSPMWAGVEAHETVPAQPLLLELHGAIDEPEAGGGKHPGGGRGGGGGRGETSGAWMRLPGASITLSGP